jgi:hypothetical protein
MFDAGYRWIMGEPVTRLWLIEHAYLFEVRGMPTVKLRMEIHAHKDFKARRRIGKTSCVLRTTDTKHYDE